MLLGASTVLAGSSGVAIGGTGSIEESVVGAVVFCSVLVVSFCFAAVLVVDVTLFSYLFVYF